MASCLVKYIQVNHDPAENKLVLVSDHCSGQNKNINLVLTSLHLVHGDTFNSVRHVFLVPGHSYMPCDRKFGSIELTTEAHQHFHHGRLCCLNKERSIWWV